VSLSHPTGRGGVSISTRGSAVVAGEHHIEHILVCPAFEQETTSASVLAKWAGSPRSTEDQRRGTESHTCSVGMLPPAKHKNRLPR